LSEGCLNPLVIAQKDGDGTIQTVDWISFRRSFISLYSQRMGGPVLFLARLDCLWGLSRGAESTSSFWPWAGLPSCFSSPVLAAAPFRSGLWTESKTQRGACVQADGPRGRTVFYHEP
jgi:hypothetical protein